MRRTASSTPPSCSPSAKVRAARIGPTVCELDGPMPILKMSSALTDTARPSAAGAGVELQVDHQLVGQRLEFARQRVGLQALGKLEPRPGLEQTLARERSARALGIERDDGHALRGEHARDVAHDAGAVVADEFELHAAAAARAGGLAGAAFGRHAQTPLPP